LGLDTSPRPGIANGEVLSLARLDVLLLGVGKGPDFVALGALGFYVSELLVVAAMSRLIRLQSTG
jgi:hypothetical protein